MSFSRGIQLKEKILLLIKEQHSTYSPKINTFMNISNDAFDLARLVAITKQKLHWINESLQYALKHDEALLLARSTKLYMEHLSGISYILCNCAIMETSPHAFKRTYQSVYYYTLFNSASIAGMNLEFINITKMVSTLYPKANKDYNYINDFTHPYFGSNFIALSEEESNQFEIYRHLDRERQITKVYVILQTVMKKRDDYFNQIGELILDYDRIIQSTK